MVVKPVWLLRGVLKDVVRPLLAFQAFRRCLAIAVGRGTQVQGGRLDDELIALRTKLQKTYPSQLLDFYEPPLKEQ